MKTKLLTTLACVAFQSVLLSAFAQGTAFTYQGRLNNGAAAANGFYDLTFELFNVSSGAGQVGSTLTSTATPISNGLFTVTLDFGAQFPGADRWLEIAVRTNGPGAFSTLLPRQKLAAAPYAVTAGTVTGAITPAQLPASVARLNVADTTSQATGTPVITSGFITSANVTFGGSGYSTPPVVTVNAPVGSGAAITANVSGGAVVSLAVMNAGSGYTSGATLTIAPPPGNSFQVFTSTNYFSTPNYLTNVNNIIAGNGSGLTGLWNLTGNAGTTPGTSFLGTKDDQPLELRVNGMRALRIEFGGDTTLDEDTDPEGAPNLIGGAPNNYVAPQGVGNVIGGGGFTNLLGFAQSNAIFGIFAVIGGGFDNTVMTNGFGSVIAGGTHNGIGAGIAQAVVGGGSANTNWGSTSVIGGGAFNTIVDTTYDSVIGGGRNNYIDSATAGAVIAAGTENYIGFNANNATIGGGNNNTNAASTFSSTISGGGLNLIQTSATSSLIGGGYQNTIQTLADLAVINGGFSNLVLTGGDFAMIPGGDSNVATNYAFAAGRRAKALHAGAFVWGDATNADIASTNANSMTFRASGGVRFFSNGGATAGVFLAPGGTSWASISDRNAKKDFAAVDSREILEKLAAMPITQWHYLWEETAVTPHIGPMAQDFKAAFYPGTDDKSITTQEADGVALAAIQGLNQKLEETRAENTALKQRLEKLERVLETHSVNR